MNKPLEDGYTAWVIEWHYPEQPVMYYKRSAEGEWTENINECVHFCREQDAREVEGIRGLAECGKIYVHEHSWGSGSQTTAPDCPETMPYEMRPTLEQFNVASSAMKQMRIEWAHADEKGARLCADVAAGYLAQVVSNLMRYVETGRFPG